MFRHLNPNLLSSNSQSTQVFFYPGATSDQMLHRLKQDPEFKALKKSNIKRVIILTGTNYTDSIFTNVIDFETAVQDINSRLVLIMVDTDGQLFCDWHTQFRHLYIGQLK